MKLFVDISPAFYKTLLFNQLSKEEDIFVVYIEDPNRPYRDDDFLKGEKQFNHTTLKGSKISVLIKLLSIVRKTKYDKLIVGGYDAITCWLPMFVSPCSKNGVIVESSYRETNKNGLKRLIKCIFFKFVRTAYVCGKSHADLVKAFGFKGKIVDIGTVGFIRRVPQPKYEERKVITKFLYVGRLTKVKNVEWLIERFRNHPELELTIIGTGDLENKLRSIAPDNVKMIGTVQNSLLPKYYQNADVFVLPSLSEPYGLVVEEALNNGTPVLVSHMIGCQDNLVAANNAGLVFQLDDENDFEEKLSMICNPDCYNKIRYNISKLDFEEFENRMKNCFID